MEFIYSIRIDMQLQFTKEEKLNKQVWLLKKIRRKSEETNKKGYNVIMNAPSPKS